MTFVDDLKRVGPNKPLAYQHLDWIKDESGLSRREVEAMVRAEGNECFVENVHNGKVHPTIYAWHEASLRLHLSRYEGHLRRDGWPIEPLPFVERVARENVPSSTQLHAIIGMAFADRRYPPPITVDPAEFMVPVRPNESRRPFPPPEFGFSAKVQLRMARRGVESSGVMIPLSGEDTPPPIRVTPLVLRSEFDELAPGSLAAIFADARRYGISHRNRITIEVEADMSVVLRDGTDLTRPPSADEIPHVVKPMKVLWQLPSRSGVDLAKEIPNLDFLVHTALVSLAQHGSFGEPFTPGEIHRHVPGWNRPITSAAALEVPSGLGVAGLLAR